MELTPHSSIPRRRDHHIAEQVAERRIYYLHPPSIEHAAHVPHHRLRKCTHSALGQTATLRLHANLLHHRPAQALPDPARERARNKHAIAPRAHRVAGRARTGGRVREAGAEGADAGRGGVGERGAGAEGGESGVEEAGGVGREGGE